MPSKDEPNSKDAETISNKAGLSSEIDRLINLIRTRSTSVFTLFFLRPEAEQKTKALYSACITLKKKVIAADDATQSLMDLEMEFLELEIMGKRRAATNNLVPKGVGLFVGIIILFLVLKYRYDDVTAFITITLGIKDLGHELIRAIVFGIAGAFVYLFMSLLSRPPVTDAKDQLAKIIDFMIRLPLAIIAPIILVVLLFNPDGTIIEKIKPTPELLSFLCGYSAKLIMDVLNKLVEKVTKMIGTL
ncbi:hypothetical protein [Candidatus Magnetominusculus dajiuhuensis]|uniref:hypothetical protein n=1 Tax=Candidatus Magnetominusculus dajiuhuensis TaxID=3137712 RepID=UPI003B43A5D3